MAPIATASRDSPARYVLETGKTRARGANSREEFVALLPNTTVEGARLVAERIQLRLKDRAIPHMDSTVSDRVTLSIGIAYMLPSTGGSVDDLMLGADVALYQAKRRGRDQVFVKTPVEAVRLVKTEKPA